MRWPTAAVRAVAGVDVAAVLLTDALPVDIRHASKIDRSAGGPPGRSTVLAGRRARRGAAVRVLVTGASGMLGGAVADALAERGDDGHACCSAAPPGARTGRCSPTSPTRPPSAAAVAGQDAVVHLAAKVDVTGSRARLRAHQRDRHPQRARRPAGRPASRRLVHVSSPSVAHAGRRWSVPAPARPTRSGPAATTPAARRWPSCSRSAADPGPPAVVAIRPHLVWGPGDTQLVGRIVERARAGRLFAHRFRGRADRHHLRRQRRRRARRGRSIAAPELDGQALVVSNGEPRPVADLLASICRAAGVPPPRGLDTRPGWPAPPARCSTRPGPRFPSCAAVGDPPLTRFLAEQLSTAHWFDQRYTRSALGWTPRVTLDSGLAALATDRGTTGA